MNIICLQMNIIWEDPAANRSTISRMLENADLHPGDMVILPELCLTGFTMNTDLAEPVGGESEHFFSNIASALGVFVVVGLAVRTGAGVANQAVVFGSNGQVLSRYNKIHPFTLLSENEYYSCGSDPVLVDIDGIMVSTLICYDLRFPETFRTAVANGAELFIVIANWPRQRMEHWHALIAARAIENQAYVIGVNRVGAGGGVDYIGGSIIIDPNGRQVDLAGKTELVLNTAVDLSIISKSRAEFPAVRDMKS